jgi:Ca2+-binding EF-hand superfamily protein
MVDVDLIDDALARRLAGRCRAALLLTALVIVPEASAQSFDDRAMERFAVVLFGRIDLDQDGRVTREEYESTNGGGFPVDFDLLDLDADGSVSRGEYLTAVRRYHQSGSGKRT